jgi:hypothetical protein
LRPPQKRNVAVAWPLAALLRPRAPPLFLRPMLVLLAHRGHPALHRE